MNSVSRHIAVTTAEGSALFPSYSLHCWAQ